ncbi:carbohydrate-binding family 6 protein [Flavivirga algicola]|uniref:Carbohydrate-binding family 6 protein n=1 Tax=Flavivirga algicola TaxID=2729136 RepID=A0ABX1S0E7_9FLAO|nr:carbohydrate-binding family 6 protein [Flavivirga algicola]NMH87919.1 carbohydrate-binding family 6 protein [Flavivirga algicola]
MKHFVILLISFLALTSCANEKTIEIAYDSSIPQVDFAVTDLTKALHLKSYKVASNGNFTIKFKLEENSSSSQGFKIEKVSDSEILIKSSDANGLMYGGLELTELINIGKDIHSITKINDKPYIKRRGIKFNIPLDVRTSSFDDSGDSAQNNIIDMWNLEFWEQFFDNMARHRYNTISYWNAHPFSSMVKLDDYPDVALQDVCGTTIKPQENGNYWNVPEMPSSKIIANLKVLKKMTIDEKIVFWQKVMKHAKNRGIDIYFITWNICLNGASPPGPNWENEGQVGKYGITNDYKNEISKDYLRKSVKQFLLNYPDVTGIGVTAGENMRTPMNDDDKEKWLWETYGLGILDAKKTQTDRTVNFIHRFWWTDMKIVNKYWDHYPDPFEMSFKYAKAHMYSAVNPPFYKPFAEWMKTENLKSWWNLRNDDIFIHRWGDPQFASDFIKHLPFDQTAGYHMGSDGYVWGREFISKQPATPRQLEIDKHWYNFMLWGRLGYNPDIPKNRFQQILAFKYPETDAELLMNTWAEASKIIPQVTRFAWGDWDFHWQPEACMEIWNDLKSVDKFRTNPTMEGSGILNVSDYVKAVLNNKDIKSITPLDVVSNLTTYSSNAIKNADTLLAGKTSEELKQTLLDIKSMSFLGAYYAHKINGAVALEFYKNNGEASYKEKAIEHLKNAAASWEKYTNINVPRYERQNFARLRTFDWEKQLEIVKKEVDFARNIKTYEEEKNSDKKKI